MLIFIDMVDKKEGIIMTMLMQIEDEIKSLSRQEFSKLREWFQKYENELWDKQIKDDSKSGKLDTLLELAIGDFKNK